MASNQESQERQENEAQYEEHDVSILDTDMDDSGDCDLVKHLSDGIISSQIMTTMQSKGSKRKASPFLKQRAKRTAMPRKCKGNQFSESLLTAFKDPVVIKTLGPLLLSIIQPVIQSSIKTAVGVEVIKILKSNTALKGTVEKQEKLVTEQRVELDKLRKECDKKSKTIDDLQDTVDKLSSKFEAMESSLNDIEQYGRRNSLRFTNIKLDPKVQETELTDQMTNFINTKILKKGTTFSASDIDRCHPIGRKISNGRGQVLVKFYSYHTKSEIFYSKANLRNSPDRNYVNEDLANYNYKMVKILKDMKKADKVYGYWTRNGNVQLKDPKKVNQ